MRIKVMTIDRTEQELANELITAISKAIDEFHAERMRDRPISRSECICMQASKLAQY